MICASAKNEACWVFKPKSRQLLSLVVELEAAEPLPQQGQQWADPQSFQSHRPTSRAITYESLSKSLKTD